MRIIHLQLSLIYSCPCAKKIHVRLKALALSPNYIQAMNGIERLERSLKGGGAAGELGSIEDEDEGKDDTSFDES